MKPTVRARIRQEIDLPTITACWVLAAHLFVLLSALPLTIAMQRYRVAFANPALIYAGVAIYTAGIAFECAQNTLDRWYLTHTDESLCDGLFYSFMVAGFGLIAMGASDAPAVWAIAIAVALAHPLFYFAGSWVRFPLLTLALLLVDYAMYRALNEPIVFVHTLGTFAGLYFLALLMRTRAQSFHGCAALCFGLSIYAFPWGIQNYAQGKHISWLMLAVATAALSAPLAMLWPWLTKIAATSRQHAALTEPTLDTTDGLRVRAERLV